MSKRILIVEDDALIAMSLADDVADAGYTVVGPCLNIAKALDTVAQGGIDAAVLDLDLAGARSDAVAAALSASDIPFVVVSGYADETRDGPFTAMPTLNKPLQINSLLTLLRAM